MKASFHSVTPLMPAGKSLAEALAFYTEQLGFSVVWQGGMMAGILRDGVAFNLIENDTQDWVENASFSVGVSNLEALYEEYRHCSAKVGELEMKAWGRREFHLIAPPRGLLPVLPARRRLTTACTLRPTTLPLMCVA
jgi:catechol 2,3-dioxygenase-like lactoylglutathione lyase family enzyme